VGRHPPVLRLGDGVAVTTPVRFASGRLRLLLFLRGTGEQLGLWSERAGVI